MKKFFILPLLTFMCLFSFNKIGHAELQQEQKTLNVLCGQRDEIVKKLNDKYDEHQYILGLKRDQSLMEIFKSKDGDTWTVLVSYPTGRSCLLFGGAYLEIMTPKKVIKGPKI